MLKKNKAGDALQAAVYGHDLSRRISSVASAIGIPPGAASFLMGLLMSTVVGLLGREVRKRGLDAASLVHVLRGERETIERAMPADLVNRANRRPDRAALRGVAPPRQTPVPTRATLWPWLLALLVLGGLALWYFTQPAGIASSLSGTQWRWTRTLFRAGSERRPIKAATYVLDFQHDGRLVVQSDCNTGKGSYTGSGTTVTLGTLTGTAGAVCGDLAVGCV